MNTSWISHLRSQNTAIHVCTVKQQLTVISIQAFDSDMYIFTHIKSHCGEALSVQYAITLYDNHYL